MQGPLEAQENQSLPVQKKVQLGYSSSDALSHHSTLYTPVGVYSVASSKLRLLQAFHICQGE